MEHHLNSSGNKLQCFFTMGYIVSILSSVVLFSKFVTVGNITLEGGLLTYPITYAILNIIAEVYGYQAVRRHIWSAIVWANFFSLATTIIINLPSPADLTYSDAFQQVLGFDYRFTFAGSIAIFVSSFSVAFFMAKFKILLNGRKYWLRFFVTLCVGELVDTFIVFIIGLTGTMPIGGIFKVIITAYIYKIIITSILVIPSTYIAYFAKRFENIDVYDKKTNFNPFTLQ